MKITKRQLKRIIREEYTRLNEAEQGLGATTFEEWVDNDDSVYPTGSPGSQEYEWACDPSGGTAELEYIIKRLRELYRLGGSVGTIQVMHVGVQKPGLFAQPTTFKGGYSKRPLK